MVFIDSANGAKLHEKSGLLCPASLGSFSRTSTFAISNDNVSCNYKDGASIQTIYATRTGRNARDYLKSSTLSAAFVMQRSGFQLDDEMTLACTLSGLLVAGSKTSKSGANAGSAEPYVFDTQVLKSNTGLSMIAVSPYNDQMIKVRYTTRTSSAPTTDDLVKMCIEASNNILTIQESMGRKL